MMNNNTKLKVFLCLIAIIIAILVTYKITNPMILIPEPEIDEYPVSSSEYLIKQKEKMDKIVANFNDVKLINKYANNYSLLRASFKGNTIIVDYKDSNLTKNYVFVLDSDKLIIDVSKKDTDVFDKIFKIMVEANQKRLGNNLDFSDYFVKISNHDISTKAFAIYAKDSDSYQYVIYVDKVVLLLN